MHKLLKKLLQMTGLHSFHKEKTLRATNANLQQLPSLKLSSLSNNQKTQNVGQFVYIDQKYKQSKQVPFSSSFLQQFFFAFRVLNTA
jgi:hypothetical protein